MIKNEARIKDDHIREIRSAIRHRATWFYFLLDEARKRGLEWDDFARKAIFRTGCLHGESNFTKTSDLGEFAGQFANKLSRQLFEMDVTEATENRLVIEFNYCPLVSAWKNLTDDQDEIAHLCDIAMDGDRGIASTFPGFRLDIQETIASGGDVCRLVFTAEKMEED
ncbi:MAG: L-2-amino-thiazoline-4-carboxylic acid hydrolase [Deltaproteobacteria bacterium]|nr:L-2-amino-thiazoline-4-carboxylic acid hydrolase [Deltaproteobacteria bacterium]MBW2051468.1 L-2-amino-thiazoline-4-carboxylic acid hydrolase [Deltaproteobacteria bacterium]MBW2140578.1 L-2-amino-thiazoline-4-carboxylic acid hydrolase [Deltaproteobacteria bacterium]MBW2323262.1 L-2-amino-thiazoline-4-carboxylic acid hydrolase [Deltaproteobacteria bacterium]